MLKVFSSYRLWSVQLSLSYHGEIYLPVMLSPDHGRQEEGGEDWTEKNNLL